MPASDPIGGITSPSGYSGPRWTTDEVVPPPNPTFYSAPPPITSAYFAKQTASLPSLAGKTVAVTGCTTGTGYSLAKLALEKGGSVVMLNRQSPRAVKAAADLAALGKVKHIDCDLSSFTSVREAAKTLRETLDATGLDIICCNAGVMALEDAPTVDGFEYACVPY